MFGENCAQQWVKTFIDHCESGKLAELRFYCEEGHLKVTMCADLGPVIQKNVKLFGCRGVPSGSPSRLRRRERRAAEQAAAEIAAAEKVAAAEKAVIARVAVEMAVAEKVAAGKYTAEKAATEKCTAEKADAEKRAAEKAAAEKCAVEKAAAEKCAAEKDAAEKCAAEKAAAVKYVAEKAAAEKCAAEKAAVEREASEEEATTSVSPCLPSGQSDISVPFSEFRTRWINRLEKCTDDWDLKTELLETLEDAYLAPASVLSDRDFNEVKDKFFQGVLSPVRFLDDLQKLLCKK